MWQKDLYLLDMASGVPYGKYSDWYANALVTPLEGWRIRACDSYSRLLILIHSHCFVLLSSTAAPSPQITDPTLSDSYDGQ